MCNDSNSVGSQLSEHVGIKVGGGLDLYIDEGFQTFHVWKSEIFQMNTI